MGMSTSPCPPISSAVSPAQSSEQLAAPSRPLPVLQEKTGEELFDHAVAAWTVEEVEPAHLAADPLVERLAQAALGPVQAHSHVLHRETEGFGGLLGRQAF